MLIRLAVAIPAMILPTLIWVAILNPEEPPLTVETAQKAVTTTGQTLYLLTYSYNFTAHKRIYVDQLGIVPARGQFTYLTDNPRILVHDVAYTKVLYNATPTVFVPPDLARIDLPGESAFGRAGFDERWACSTPFQTIASSLLTEMGVLFKAYEQAQLRYLITVYTPLEHMPSNIRAQIALLVSQPHNVEKDQFWFRVQMILRERLVKQDKWRETVRQETLDTGAKWAKAFIKRLLEQGGRTT